MLRILAWLTLASSPIRAAGDPADLVKRQCRSIHLGYETPELRAAYMEVVPLTSAPGTYFCALGFHLGYFGIQELADGKKIAIFSVWEPENAGGGDQAVLLAKGEGVGAGRFGGEGTGGQSRLDFPWQIGQPVSFLVKAETDGGFTEFTGSIYDPARSEWRLMAVFRAPGKGVALRGLYSFVEDFRRNYESAGIARSAEFRNARGMDLAGKWFPIEKARFTGDITPSANIDAGPAGEGFFLSTGGDTREGVTKLGEMMERRADGKFPAILEKPPGL